MIRINMVQQEKHPITFMVKDANGDKILLAGKQLKLFAKRKLEEKNILFSKVDTDFSKTENEATVNLNSTDLNFYGNIFLIFEIELDGLNKKKEIFEINLTPDVRN